MNDLTTVCEKASKLGYEVFEFPSGIGADIGGHRIVWITEHKESRLIFRNSEEVPDDLQKLLENNQ